MKLGYSYIRFSTPIQKLGRSYDRQMEACVAWCVKHGVQLAEDTFYDEGKSGYTGDHLGEKGQLKRFLDEVEVRKTIPKGSYLIIESLDRLSRQSVNDALTLFLRILSADIKIVTLMDNEKVYSKGVPANDLIMSVLVMARANEESETKAKRGRDDWQDKFAMARATKKPVGRQVAKWLELVDREDGQGKKYVENPERCDIVRRVFRECIAGKGFVAISKGLNRDAIPAFRGGNWSVASIDDLLKNRCVLGEWTPKDGKGTIEGYFPTVIDNETWGLAELAMEDRRFGRVTKQAAVFQMWQQVAQCGVCGSTMICLTKPKSSKGLDDVAKAKVKANAYRYLSCSNKLKGMCDRALNVRMDASEAVFKELLIKVGALGLIQTDAAAVTQEIAMVEKCAEATVRRKV